MFPVCRTLDAARFHQLKFIRVKCVAHGVAVSAVAAKRWKPHENGPARMPIENATTQRRQAQYLNWNKLQNVILLLMPFIVGNNIMISFSLVRACARRWACIRQIPIRDKHAGMTNVSHTLDDKKE